MHTAHFPDSGGEGAAHPPGCKPTLDADPPGGIPPKQTAFPLEADLLPLWTEWNTWVKILPCPKLRLWAVKILKRKTEVFHQVLDQQ